MVEEVEDNNYEEVPRSRPTQAAMNIHSQVKPAYIAVLRPWLMVVVKERACA